MIHTIPDVLTADDISALRAFLAEAEFIDGRVSNQNSSIKNNEQIDQSNEAAHGLGDRIVERMRTNARVARIAFPRHIIRPTLSRYVPGMAYGPHLDEAMMPSTPEPMRTDLSCTVFLSNPDEYEGGELEIWIGHQRARLKDAAGTAVLYSTGAIHQVREVTAGTRLAAVTWIQSFIKDPVHRTTLGHYYQLAERFADRASEEEKLLMESVRTNLFRLWVDS